MVFRRLAAASVLAIATVALLAVPGHADDGPSAAEIAKSFCAKPAAGLVPLCAGLAAHQPDDYDIVASKFDDAGRYAFGTVFARDAVALRRQAGAASPPGGPAPLALSLARLATLLRETGDYAAASVAADEALKLAPVQDAASRSAALLAAGSIERADAHYAAAENLLRQAAALRHPPTGTPLSPAVADVLDVLADVLGNEGKLAEALATARQAVEIRIASGGKAGAGYARSLTTLALITRANGHYADAEALGLQAQAAAQSALGSTHPDFARILMTLGIIDRSEGKLGDAEYLTNLALQIQITAFGRANPDIATTANNLALVFQQQGKLGKAESLFRQVLAIRIRTLGGSHPDVGNTYDNLAGLMRREGRLNEAEGYYKQAIEIQAAALGPDHPDVAADLANLAYVLRMQGEFDEAQALLQRALEIRERALPPGHPYIAATLVSLGDVLLAEGRAHDAELAYLQALAIQKKALGDHHPDVATTLNDLAALYRKTGRIAEAEDDYVRALDIQKAVLAPGDPEIAVTLGNVAEILALQGRFADAETLQQKALAVRIAALGKNHPLVATSLGNLAKLRRLEKHLHEAETLQAQVVGIREAAYGDDNPDVAQDYSDLAEILGEEGKLKPALIAMRKATAIYRARNAGADQQTPADADAERRAARFVFVNHVYLLEQAIRKASPAAAKGLLAESFEVAQLAQNWSVGAVVQQMAARFATGTGDLSVLVRTQQDMQDRIAKDDALLAQSALLPPGKQDPQAMTSLRQERSELDGKLNDIAATLDQKFPQYAAATSLDPVSLKAVQKMLRPEEALVSYLVGGDATFIWVVRPHSAALVKTPIGLQEMIRTVVQLRLGLDPARYAATGRMPIYDIAAAYKFYKAVFAPVRSQIGSAKRLLVIADGPLQAIPMNVLVLKPVKALPLGVAPDYRKVDWLIRHYATAMIPSVTSLRALRSLPHGAQAPQPFLGIGDPRLGGPRLKSAKISTKGVDIRIVNQLVPLPETANELRQMAMILKAPPESVVVTGKATITQVRAIDLAEYRVVAFATHGLLTGELKGLTEPAIVLTPDAGHGDDGLLRASEIAQLHFDADWVVLSACNTAASDGSVGAEGFSGLAKAFFYAGTRALVVSNWPVNSAASVQLTTNSVGRSAANKNLGKADALQASMLQLLSKGNPFFAHPMMWAPFVVVGEGGPDT